MNAIASQPDFDVEAVRRRGFAEFVRRAWSQVEPAELLWSWHLDAICEHLEALYRREIRRLVINVPPGCSKSLVTSVLWPSYVWTLDPSHRFIVASYSGEVVLRDARKARTLIESDWFQARWPAVQLPSDASASKAVGSYSTTRGGMRYSATVRGPVMGQHADVHLVDDPIDPQGVTSSAEMDMTLEWWRGTMPTRVRNHHTIVRVLIMQRLHEKDLTQEFIREGATVLCLPLRYDSKHPHRWARDPRTQDGELLCPNRIPEAAAQEMENTLREHRAASQLGQRPVPLGGNIFREEWFKRWVELPPNGIWALSVDCTFKLTTDGSFVVIQVWYQVGPNFYLVDQRRERLDFNGTIAALRAMIVKYPKASLKLVEAKANGSAVVSTLKREFPGFIEVEPEGGKEARAYAAQPLVASGNVFVPDPERARYPDGRVGARWVEGHRDSFMFEVTTFPKADTDDMTDCLTQYLNYAAKNHAGLLRAAMDNVFKNR